MEVSTVVEYKKLSFHADEAYYYCGSTNVVAEICYGSDVVWWWMNMEMSV
jgi:hypothetical protein